MAFAVFSSSPRVAYVPQDIKAIEDQITYLQMELNRLNRKKAITVNIMQGIGVFVVAFLLAVMGVFLFGVYFLIVIALSIKISVFFILINVYFVRNIQQKTYMKNRLEGQRKKILKSTEPSTSLNSNSKNYEA